jgi:hypothetical protein
MVAVTGAGCASGGFALSPGDCVELGPGGTDAAGLSQATAVPCDEPHQLEVFHVFDLAPDELEGDALVAAVTEECLGEAFTDHVGVPAERSELELLPLPPTAAQLERGDTEVVCTLREPGGGTRTSPLGGSDADA